MGIFSVSSSWSHCRIMWWLFRDTVKGTDSLYQFGSIVSNGSIFPGCNLYRIIHRDQKSTDKGVISLLLAKEERSVKGGETTDLFFSLNSPMKNTPVINKGGYIHAKPNEYRMGSFEC